MAHSPNGIIAEFDVKSVVSSGDNDITMSAEFIELKKQILDHLGKHEVVR
jgi:hypothetical protein